MMYFEYNHEGKRPLRIPMTEEAFLKAKDEPDRWFINFGSCVLEVTETEYAKYHHERERSLYRRRYAAKHLQETLPLDTIEEQFDYSMSVFADQTERSIEDEVILREMMIFIRKRLYEALDQLDDKELKLVLEIHFKQIPQKEISKELGITQQGVSKRYQSVLRKLRKMLADLEK